MITIYVLQGTSGRRYVGITNNLQRRLKEHESGKTKASHILGEFTLLHTETVSDYKDARQREKYLKSGQGREFLSEKYPRSRSASGG